MNFELKKNKINYFGILVLFFGPFLASYWQLAQMGKLKFRPDFNPGFLFYPDSSNIILNKDNEKNIIYTLISKNDDLFKPYQFSEKDFANIATDSPCNFKLVNSELKENKTIQVTVRPVLNNINENSNKAMNLELAIKESSVKDFLNNKYLGLQSFSLVAKNVRIVPQLDLHESKNLPAPAKKMFKGPNVIIVPITQFLVGEIKNKNPKYDFQNLLQKLEEKLGKEAPDKIQFLVSDDEYFEMVDKSKIKTFDMAPFGPYSFDEVVNKIQKSVKNESQFKNVKKIIFIWVSRDPVLPDISGEFNLSLMNFVFIGNPTDVISEVKEKFGVFNVLDLKDNNDIEVFTNSIFNLVEKN